MTGHAVSWAKSDEERATPSTTAPKVIRPRLTCVIHDWGVWMRDIALFGDTFVPQPATHYRRFCRRCKAEQKGRGTVWGGDVKVTR